MKYFQLLLSLFSCIIILCSCTIKEKIEFRALINTKWEYKVAEGCINYVYFNNDSTYENYNCEIDYPFSGKFQVKNDTIYLIEIDLASELPGETQKIIKSRCKGILKDGKLKFINNEDLINGKWRKSNFKTTEEIFYEKVK